MSWVISRAMVEAYENSHSSLVPVAEFSAGTCSDGELSAQSKLNPMPQAYCSPDKMTAFSRLSRFGMTFAPLTDDRGAELLTLYLAAFRAKTSALPEAVQDSTEREADCGQSLRGSLAKYDRATHSLRTVQHSLFSDLTECSVILPRSGTMRNGACYQQPILERRTCGKESGFWQTPVADDAVNRKMGKWNSRGEPKLSAQVMLPTPTASDGTGGPGSSSGRKGGMNLRTAVSMIPTPTATAYKGWSKNHNRANSNDRIDYTIEREANESGQTGRLNPEFCEWLMGWPIGHTELKPLETDKFREWLRQHSPNSVQDADGDK